MKLVIAARATKLQRSILAPPHTVVVYLSPSGIFPAVTAQEARSLAFSPVALQKCCEAALFRVQGWGVGESVRFRRHALDYSHDQFHPG